MSHLDPDQALFARTIAAREAARLRTFGLLVDRRRLVLAGIVVSVLVLGLLCGQYLVLGAYADHIEGNVLISGWQYLHGAPLFEIEDGAPRFAMAYGPLAYLAPLPALILFGTSIAATKLTGILALIATLAVMGAHAIRRSAPGQARHGLFYLVGGLLLFVPESFWVRPDPLETLLVAVAVAAPARAWRPVVLGLCIGLAVNLKIHAGLYFLPIVVESWWSGRWRGLMIAAISSGAAFLLPFLAPGISLHDYLAGLTQQIGGRSPSWSVYVTAVVLLLVTPVALALASGGRHHATPDRVFAWTSLATAVLLVYPASFPAAGPYHFLPIVPVLAEAFRRLRPRSLMAELAPFSMLVLGLHFGAITATGVDFAASGNPAAEEALALARGSAGQPIHVGYGDTRRSYEISQLSKTMLALHGYPALIDAQSLMELRYSGFDGAVRWIPYLAECRIRVWLLPKGETPFAVSSYYDDGPLFGEAFRSAFLEHYELVGSTGNFDLWSCARDPGG